MFKKVCSGSAYEDVVAVLRQPASYAFRNRTAPHRFAFQTRHCFHHLSHQSSNIAPLHPLLYTCVTREFGAFGYPPGTLSSFTHFSCIAYLLYLLIRFGLGYTFGKSVCRLDIGRIPVFLLV
jgi:hypothetical protein